MFKKPTSGNPGTYHRRERETLSEVLEEIGETYEPMLETRIESGWDNWAITQMEDGSVHIWTDNLGARKITEPMDVMENSLEKYKEKLRAEGTHPNSATGATAIEKWLDKRYIPVD